MNVVTGRRAARDRDDRPFGAPRGGAESPRGGVGSPRGGVAPHPRVVPAAAGPEAPADTAEPLAPAVEVEPTTGAPVDAVPRRVPVRRGHSPVGSTPGAGDAAGTPDGGDGAYWPPIEQVHWDGTPIREEPKPQRRRSPGADRGTPRPPDPLPGLAVLLSLSLVAAFFAWVSAGPFWLATGHATRGEVVIVDCTGDGLAQRCRGTFTPAGHPWVAPAVRVSGVAAEETATGTTLPARMTGPDSGTAYADTGPAGHLRWLLGLLVVLGCGAGIARWTGATRLADPRLRRWAVTGALAGPLVITLGFLVAAW
ncbi:hypothetical protein [Micromonospora peucetia]|uniref:Uncharacterized protein n=1 Tax=Micromonospora peucetia TaxID=47871 RepID=A0A1C6UIV2_9ACTN|nr:hypothetical protein [Micromonospora peucetia]WSA34130.1 hypothetical protein OIE14_08855 [Micromonospora peucetia]SCL53829.1 hypothetical protein GA0070608_1232 [Micromonospora peucetia]